MEAPPGIDLNESAKTTLVAVLTFVLSVAFIALALRVYTRVVIIRKFAMDDWCAVFAFTLVFGCGFVIAWSTRNGYGVHIFVLTSEEVKLSLLGYYLSIVFYTAALGAIKITFLLQYYRVFAVQKIQKIFIIAIVVVTMWSVSQVLIGIFFCTPISFFWDQSVAGTCIPPFPQFYINAAGNVITDIIVFVLPLPIIGNLNLGSGQKYVLFGIFCLGFFTCAISIVRITFLKKITVDFTWNNVEAASWSVGELCSGLTCACLTTLGPLVSRLKISNSKLSQSSSSTEPIHNRHGDVECAGSDLQVRYPEPSHLQQHPHRSEREGYLNASNVTATVSDAGREGDLEQISPMPMGLMGKLKSNQY